MTVRTRFRARIKAVKVYLSCVARGGGRCRHRCSVVVGAAQHSTRDARGALATPPSRFVTLPEGVRVHVRERGAGEAPALVLLHGSTDSLSRGAVGEPLNDRFHIVAFDFAGMAHGAVPGGDYSEEALVRFTLGVVDSLNCARQSRWHSMAADRRAIAEEHPERVTKLILIDAGGWRTGKLVDGVAPGICTNVDGGAAYRFVPQW